MNDINLAWKLRYSNTEKAIKIASAIIESEENKKIILFAKLTLAYCNYINNKNDDILKEAYKIYEAFKNYKSEIGYVASQYFLARVYNKYNDFINAKQYAQSALDSALILNNNNEISNAYTSLGIIEKSLKNYSSALEYFNKAYKLRKDLNYKNAQSSVLNLIGRTYVHLKDYNNALKFYNKNLNLLIEINNSDDIKYQYIEIAKTYRIIENYDNAIENYNNSILSNKNYDSKIEIIAYHDLGKIYLKSNKLDEAEKYLFISKNIAQKQNNIKHLALINKTISAYYKELNDNQKSLEYFEEYHNLSLINNEKKSKLQAKYLTEDFTLKQEIKNIELKKAYEHIEEKNNDILASIKYAYRIQNAILPPDYLVKRLLPNSFILYKPKDVVSGDFYFVSEFHDKIVFSAVDCTGHGVPGALVSVIGYNWLVQGVREDKINTPGELLSFLDEGVNDTLRQTADESGVKDSMDLAVCTIDFKTNTLIYAGAYNPCYIVQNNELIEIKADKLPIGVNTDGVVDIYTDHTVKLKKGDTVYIFSDGYADQFGGPKNKKFKYRQLKEKILEMQNLPMPEQKIFLDKTLIEWQGNEEQIDDILVIGLKI